MKIVGKQQKAQPQRTKFSHRREERDSFSVEKRTKREQWKEGTKGDSSVRGLAAMAYNKIRVEGGVARFHEYSRGKDVPMITAERPSKRGWAGGGPVLCNGAAFLT